MNIKDGQIFDLSQKIIAQIRAAEMSGADQDTILQALWVASTIYQSGIKSQQIIPENAQKAQA